MFEKTGPKIFSCHRYKTSCVFVAFGRFFIEEFEDLLDVDGHKAIAFGVHIPSDLRPFVLWYGRLLVGRKLPRERPQGGPYKRNTCELLFIGRRTST